MRWPSDRIALLLAILALLVYLPGLTWGIPHATSGDRKHAWGNDDQIPLASLAEMHNTFVVAKPDRNLAYPLLHHFALAAAYSPYLLFLKATGALAAPSPEYPFGLADPARAFRALSLIGRSLTLALAVAMVIGSYYTAKHLWGRAAGVLSGVFTLVIFPAAYYARVGNLDMPALGWTSLGLAALALCLRHGLTPARGAGLGALVALAAATKDQTLGSFMLALPALMWLHWRRGAEHRLGGWQSAWAAPVATALGFVIVYVLASGIPVDPERYRQHIAKIATAGTMGIYMRHPPTAAGLAAQVGDLFGYLVDARSWPLLIAAGAGIVLAARRDRPALTLLLSSVGFFLLLVPVRLSRLHHQLAVALPLSAFAAYAFSRALEGPRIVKRTAALAVVAVVAVPLLNTLDLTHDMLFDSRYAAGAWLGRHAKPGDAILHFGPADTLPYLSADIKTIGIRHRDLALEAARDSGAQFVVVMPLDYNEDRQRVEWRRGPHSIYNDYLPAEVHDKLVDGSLGYRLVARFQTPRLIPWFDRPFLTYPTVNPPIHIYASAERAQDAPRLAPWKSPPHYPSFIRVKEMTIDRLRGLVE